VTTIMEATSITSTIIILQAHCEYKISSRESLHRIH